MPYRQQKDRKDVMVGMTEAVGLLSADKRVMTLTSRKDTVKGHGQKHWKTEPSSVF